MRRGQRIFRPDNKEDRHTCLYLRHSLQLHNLIKYCRLLTINDSIIELLTFCYQLISVDAK